MFRSCENCFSGNTIVQTVAVYIYMYVCMYVVVLECTSSVCVGTWYSAVLVYGMV